jgi:hypothetical protein
LADGITEFGDQLDPSKIYAISIYSHTPLNDIWHVFNLGRDSGLDLSELWIDSGATSDPERDRREWARFDAIDVRLDAFLETQRNLRILYIFGLPIRRIPEPVRQMRHLLDLTLAGIWPDRVPGWLFEIRGLVSLALTSNGLSSLPTSIGRARDLRHLNLGYNLFKRVPGGVWKLESLESIGLRGCPLREIPPDILKLERLSKLDFTPQRELVEPPPEIVDQGLAAIKRYWTQREAGVDYLSEAKLLIVGEAGAGKTSLAKKILDPGYALNTAEDSTEGIDVMAWQFPSGIRVQDATGEHLLQRDFRVNVWDFGGQEIYHSTHQFFLTKRSVYVLVTDERKEDTDFEYWLEIVNLLSDGSPVVIVQNRKQGRQHGIDFGALRQRYPNLCGTLVLDLADNSGLDVAVAKIRRELEQLPHIGTALPKTWRAVRLALEADSRDYISATEFFGICRTNGFADREDMEQLGGYLHDLGICLFFQDDPLLSKTVILKPDWGTTAVYRVLDDPRIAQALGMFTRADLRRTWSDKAYELMQDELLQLMIKFQLCFQVPGSVTYIAPQLLTPSQPVYAWDDADNLQLRYEYDVMPKGIVRRLIVALHDCIPPNGVLWRSGAVFEYEGSKAEVIEVYRRRLLAVRIRGGDPRILLGLIDHQLGLIHRSYPGLRLKKFMPCGCETCSASADPTMFEVGILEDFARTGDQIQCQASRRLRDPVKLLRMLTTDTLDLRSGAPITGGPAAVAREEHIKPEIFVSYKWGGAGEALVDEIQSRMAGREVHITRDKDQVRYRDSIQQFMRRLGAGKCVIVVLDKAYLESKNCMFELTHIASRPEFAARVYPIVMPDAEISDALTRVGYIKYWEGKRAELEAAMREIGQEHLEGIREELDLYEDIRNMVARITSVLGDMNTLTPEMHQSADFEQLYAQLATALRV